MKKALRNTILIATMASLAAPAQAGWREDVFNPIMRFFGAKPAVTKTVKDDCHKGGRSTRPAPKREVRKPQLDYIPGDAYVVGNFCEAGDAVKIVLPQLTDAQVENDYTISLEMEGRPKFSWFEPGLALDGYEMRSGNLTKNDRKYVKYGIQDVVKDGVTRKQYSLKMPKENFSLVLRDGHGHKKAETPFGMTVKAYDCQPTPGFIGNIFINAPNAQVSTAATASTAVASASASTSQTTPQATAETSTSTSGDSRRDSRSGFRLTRKNPWAATLGVRSLTNTLETDIKVTDRNGTKLVPHEEVYSGNALLLSLEYATPNKALSLRYADSFGTDGSGDKYQTTMENRVDAQALTLDAEGLWGKGKFKIGGFVLGEAKTVTFSQGAMGYNDATLRNRDLTAIAGPEALLGTGLDDQYVKLRAGIGIQDMEFQRPDNSPSSPNRGSGVRDTLVMGEIAARKNFTEGIALFGNYRHMRTLASESTTPMDEVLSTQIDNYRAGVDLRLFGNDDLHLILQAGHARERAEFPDGVRFDNSGTVYDGILKYHFGGKN